MDRIWYVRVEKEVEGPFSVEDLRVDGRITLRTLAWKKGMPVWLPIAAIPELAEALFGKKERDLQPSPEGVLTLDREQLPFSYLWILLALLLMIFLYYFL